MKSNDTFKQRILGLQGNLLSFAYQLTTNREQAQDLLQDTTLKALDNEDKYRIPFNMYVAGYKYSEIAEKMNLPLGTIKSRIFFARKSLRAQLKDYRS